MPPIIVSHKWGEIQCSMNGFNYTFKDCVINPNGAVEWDWGADGTRHQPGITVRAVSQLVNTCDVIILTRGVQNKLHTMPDVFIYLNSIGKRYEQLQTNAAIERYNALVAQGVRVGGLFHSTC